MDILGEVMEMGRYDDIGKVRAKWRLVARSLPYRLIPLKSSVSEEF
jgi:hypothetical protein